MTIPPELLRNCWYIAGPTAVGKTALSLCLAERLGGEILSLDSMAIYRGMDIGTAKPTRAEREQVPHHLLDLVEPHEEFSTVEYLQHAEQAIREVRERGQTPIFVGGTGLYLRSLLRGVFEGPAADWEYRRELEQREQAEPGCLWRELQLRDATTAARLHPHDQRRIIRALEVCELTGQPLSVQQQQQPLPPEERPRHIFWLHPPRDWLAERINQRVEQMFSSGLVEEVRTLLQRTPPPGRTAAQGLGYKEVMAHLRGETDLPTTVTIIQTRTRQFAKRQHTWFRNLPECQEIPLTGTETAPELIASLLHVVK